LLRTPYGKTAHGLLRGSRRFSVVGVVEPGAAPGDAGSLIGSIPLGIPLTASIESAIAAASTPPTWAIIGIATPGGRMSATLRELALTAVRCGLSIVNGLHDYLSDDAEIAAAACRNQAMLVDLRKPKPPADMSFWSGAICRLPIARIAVLGTDCIIGKRTTATLLVAALRARRMRAEMIYTGQTGWLQGVEHGCILDATLNDFVAGELEAALLACARSKSPDVMIIEGQSSMQNPSGPCGAELILGGDVHGVVLQHAPGRGAFSGLASLAGRAPSLETEIRILAAYDTPLLGICLNFAEAADLPRHRYVAELRECYGVPVVAPFIEPLDAVVDAVEPLVRRSRMPD